jgi:trimeric autotransporter adhesin
MRRSAVWFLLAILVLLIAALTACGGGNGSSTTVGAPATVTVSPTSASGDIGRLVASLSVTVTDAKGNVVSNPPTITFASSNTAVATVSSAGAVCAGTWDANNVVCTPGAVGSATITVTSGSVSATVPVFTHAHIDRLLVTPASVNCKSQGQTVQMTAQALSNGTDITSTVGPITWNTGVASVATVDSNGLATAANPGVGRVFASVGATNSVPASFITCPVFRIRVHVASAADTTFNVAQSATQQLAADVLDSAANTITVPLTWASSQPVVATVNAAGLVSGLQPGTTTITATCASSCNIGQSPVYGNVVIGSVNGTSANVVYAGETGTTSLVPIDTTTNTVGSAITLPTQANSLLVNRLGTNAFLGSGAGLMTLITSTNVASNDASHPGTVLAISPDGTWIVVAGASTVFLVNTTTLSASQTLNITGATAAAFTPDSSKVFITAGNLLWSLTPGGTPASNVEPATLTDAAVLASGGFGYFGTAANNVLAVASCDNVPLDTLATPGSPSLIATLPNGNAILAVDPPFINVITPSTTLDSCPPPLSDTLASKDFGQGSFTARQLIVLPDSSKAYVANNTGLLMVYDVATGVAGAIPLAGGAAPLAGAATLDSKSVYVGASDNKVHRIDVATGADVQQIPVSFIPDLVALRPK